MSYKALQRLNSFSNTVKRQSVHLYKLDLGGAPTVQEPPTQKSRCGVITSAIVLIIILFFIILTISQFSKGIPSIVYTSQIPSSYETFHTPKLGILVKDGSNKEIFDPNLFIVKYSYVNIFNQDQQPRVKRVLTTERCSFEAIGLVGQHNNQNINMSALVTSSALCPNESVALSGTFEMPLYQYLEAEVQRCVCPVPVQPTCTCYNDTYFDSVFWEGSIAVLFSETIPSYSPLARKVKLFPDDPDMAKPPTSVENTRSYLWKNIKLFMNRVDFYVRRTTIYNGPRYLFDYTFSEFFGIGDVAARPDDFTPGSPLLFKAYFRLDAYDVQEIRQSPQLLQLLGSWGALWSFFSLTVLTLVRMWNRRVFERKQDHQLHHGHGNGGSPNGADDKHSNDSNDDFKTATVSIDPNNNNNGIEMHSLNNNNNNNSSNTDLNNNNNNNIDVNNNNNNNNSSNGGSGNNSPVNPLKTSRNILYASAELEQQKRKSGSNYSRSASISSTSSSSSTSTSGYEAIEMGSNSKTDGNKFHKMG